MTLKTRNFADGAVTLAKFASGRILTAAYLATTVKTGRIDLPLPSWRMMDVATVDYDEVAVDTGVDGSGGIIGSDATSTPQLIRVSAGTDTTARIIYADGVLTTLLNDFTLPSDVDASAALTFKALCAMSGTNNSTTVLTLTWVAVGTGAYAAGADQGGNTSAVVSPATSLQVVSKSIVAAAINAPGNHVSVSITPTSPGTDNLHIYATWVEYTRV